MVGCGFVADMYMHTLRLHPELELIGVFDQNQKRLQKFTDHYSISPYISLEHLLNDQKVDIVLNLTNPNSHYDITKLCLKSNKHVYSEKPLAMNMEHAIELVELAEKKGLQLSSAPCSLLSETAQTMWKALREERIGPVRVVYAEMDDGPVHTYAYKSWISESGTPWPYKDEFEIGCTIEHAGYSLTWLVAFFGPAEQLTAFRSIQIPHKCNDTILDRDAADFTVACIRFASGVVARLTCSIIAPHDHELKIVGDNGVLITKDTWFYRSPVYTQNWLKIRRRTFLSPWKKRIPIVGKKNPRPTYRGASNMDFCRGVAEMVSAIMGNRTSRLSPRFSLHITELALAISGEIEHDGQYEVTSKFDPIDPMPWAK